ncbi:hypothetical protein [Streptomyces reniochalinae]|uniref:Uncharacterized protein n=1 Tax=Streptomyces reniochalinae TaxID=2250578 RepID=A0A367EUK7_9ACTN|nr:hypothetical protein [Streptomyces reniochalinae]RCG21806.1 hypothetical protein DQ392_08850 [Streptomyces reniochalinae]
MTTIPALLAHLSGGDTPQAAVDGARCLLPPIGCGRSLTDGDLPTEVAAREWRISGLCPQCYDRAAPAEDDGQLAEQKHLLSDEDAAFDLLFAGLAITHPEACHTPADYLAWTAGGAA